MKYTIAGFPNLMNNFTKASNYVGQIIDLNKKSNVVTRSVSLVNTAGTGGRGQGIEGR